MTALKMEQKTHTNVQDNNNIYYTYKHLFWYTYSAVALIWPEGKYFGAGCDSHVRSEVFAGTHMPLNLSLTPGEDCSEKCISKVHVLGGIVHIDSCQLLYVNMQVIC